MATDPFAVLGLEPRLELDPDELETRYLRLARDTHPDHNASAEDQARVLSLAADLNNAYRTLSDIWSRARALIDLLDAEAFARNEKLPPDVLIEAMETAEAVAEATAETAPGLRAKLTTDVDRYRSQLADALGAGDADRSARLLHESRYTRKALEDLASRIKD